MSAGLTAEDVRRIVREEVLRARSEELADVIAGYPLIGAERAGMERLLRKVNERMPEEAPVANRRSR